MTDGVLEVSVLMVDTTLVGKEQTHVSVTYHFCLHTCMDTMTA